MSSSAGTPSAPSLKAAGSGRASSIEPSPASTYGGSVSSDAGDGVPHTPNDDGAFLAKIAKLTIKTDADYKNVKTKLYSPPFVRNGSQGRAEDPFTSPVTQRHGSAQRTPTDPKFMNRAVKSDNWRSGSSSGSGSNPSSPSADKALRSAQRGRVFVSEYGSKHSKSKSLETPIKAEDAQAVFPPSSCVFVANLLQSETDEALEVAVTQVFREYGTVWVKIRRDSKHMPFAFCQYSNDQDAARAIKEGRGRTIKGRPCRCEKAKAHRLFFFERKYGPAVTPGEVNELLRVFGRINYCRLATDVERATHNLGEGVVVHFEMYDEGQLAHQAYRNHDEYKMQSLANMGTTSPSRGRVSDREDPVGRHYLEEYDIERRSIYVGNLPTDAENEELKGLFFQFGNIIKVTLHKIESRFDPAKFRCFAFVEFESQPSVTLVLGENYANGFTLRGTTLRVAQKDTHAAAARSQRRRSEFGAQTPVGPYQSPAPQPTAPQPTAPQHVSPVVCISQSGLVTLPPSPAFQTPLAYQHYNTYGYGSPMYPGYNGYAGYCNTQQYSPFSWFPNSPTYGIGYNTASSPLGQQYNMQGYQTNPTYGSSPSALQSGFQPAYAMVNTSSQGQDDRSGTPTPAGHGSGFESLDSQ
ncbi:hypothetical protein BDZ45DRAFT_718148 [Acephala macrosclerotiorum]|nr:hypothetical protein BDZ45DRAFT_718148 [Acephala macrosclerotiorum]